MNQSQTNIKFSPGRELYPGTMERVCIITGQIPNIVAAVKDILERIRNSDSNREQETGNNLKMLVSNIASGMVIGKSGSTVKMIQVDYNVRIQITGKDETRGLPERTLTIIACNLEYILSAFQNILERIAADPEGERWRRLVSYNEYNLAPPTSSSKSRTNSVGSNSFSATPSNQVDYSTFLQAFLQPGQSHSYSHQPGSNSFSRLNSTGGTSGGVVGSPMGTGTAASTNFLQAAASMSDTENHQMGLSNAMISYIYSQSLTSGGGYFTNFPPVVIDGVNLSVPGSTLSTYEVAIPEVMVKILFGEELQLLADIMRSTNTRMELSNKGDYITGTYNRKLTIAGPILSVQAAHLIVMQNIVKEQEVFRKQGLI